MAALERPGYALSPGAACCAGVLTLEVNRALRPAPSGWVLQGAAGIELLVEASFVLDHVADGDGHLSGCPSMGKELALGLGLVGCGIGAVERAVARTSANNAAGDLFTGVVGDCLDSVAGLFMEAHQSCHTPLTTDDALRLVSAKAGSLGKLVGTVGAGLTTTDERVIALFTEFGANLFTYLQLLDDLRDICPADESAADILRGRQTLPVVYFHNYLIECPSGAVPPGLDGVRSAGYAELRGEVASSGALAFGIVAAEAFLDRARNNLGALSRMTVEVGHLERFLESVVISPQESVAFP